jgi:hypothetical protein
MGGGGELRRSAAASASPWAAVQALALPLLPTMPRIRSAETASTCWQKRTRGGLDVVGREDAGGGARMVGDDERQVEAVGAFVADVAAGGAARGSRARRRRPANRW